MSITILDEKGRSLGLNVSTLEDAIAAFRRNPRAEIARDERGVIVARRPHRTRSASVGACGPQASLFGVIPTKAPLK